MPLPAGYTQGTIYVLQTQEEATWLRRRRYTMQFWLVGNEIRFAGPANARETMHEFSTRFGVGIPPRQSRPKTKGYYPNVITPLPLP